jgi:hypothetical protein
VPVSLARLGEVEWSPNSYIGVATVHTYEDFAPPRAGDPAARRRLELQQLVPHAVVRAGATSRTRHRVVLPLHVAQQLVGFIGAELAAQLSPGQLPWHHSSLGFSEYGCV